MTKQRELILSIVLNSPEHMTAQQIFEIAKEQMPGIVRATVYNNLNVLSDQKLICRVQVPNAPDHFDKTTSCHTHLLCDCCGRMIDAMGVPDYVPLIEEKYGIKVNRLESIAHYICPNCLEEIEAKE